MSADSAQNAPPDPAAARLTAVLPSATVAVTGALMTVKSSISLTEEQHAFARALVAAGRFTSVSAVVQHGIDLLKQRMDVEDLERQALREVLSRRRSGEFVTADAMDARLGRMIADKRRSHGVSS